MRFFKNVLLSLFLVFSITLNIVYSQNSTTFISGIVLDSDNNPIPGVNVFVSGTTIGTSSNSDGEFRFFFKNMPDDRYSLIFSNILYKKFEYKFETPVKKNALILKVFLEEDIKELNEITVTAERDKKWEKNFKLFEEALLGQTDNGANAEIVNPEILSFIRKNGRMIAHSDQDLKIKNPDLGYEITANLKLFDWSLNKKGGVFLFNYLQFSDVKSDDKAENKIITLKRYHTYQNSIRRFFKLLNENKNLREYDYNITTSDINLVKKRDQISFQELVDLNIAIPNKQDYRNVYLYEISYQFRRSLKVSFNGNESTIRTKNKQPILVDANGNIINTSDVVISGFWAKQRTADMLPFDYQPPEEIRLY